MKIEELMKLIDAGYTKSEIEALTGTKEEPKEDPKKEESKKDTKEEPKEESKQDTKEESKQDTQTADMLELIVQKFDELRSAVQESNINKSNNKLVADKTPEDMLAEIIRPPRKKDK